MIQCQWRQLKKSPWTVEEETKCGRYHNSVFNVEGYGKSQWAICGYLEADFDKYLEEGMSEEDIIKGCVEYLNVTPTRKKYQKKKPVPKFGNLKLIQAKLKEADNKRYIEIILGTDQRKSKMFWGEGSVIAAR